MSRQRSTSADLPEINARAESWPRSLIEDGSASKIAAAWVESLNQACSQGLPPIARYSLSRPIAEGLFDARRARRLERGLEGAEALLSAEEVGLLKTPATQVASDAIRISRLLMLSADGSPRFYRQAEKLRSRFARRVEVLILECDEEELGAAAFGPGRRARALLIHHKEAVASCLSLLGR